MTRRDTVKVVEETGTLLSLQSGMSIQVAVRPEVRHFPAFTRAARLGDRGPTVTPYRSCGK